MSKRTIREAARHRSSRRQSRWLLIGGIVIVAVLVVVGLIQLGSATNTVGQVDVNRYKGIPQEIDRTGAPGLALGDPKASVTLIEYADFSCPHCREMYDTMHQLVDLYVRTGKLRIIYKPVFFINPTYSPGAAKAVLCAGEKGKGWEMHDQVWYLYDVSQAGGYNLSAFAARAQAIGLDAGEFSTCYNSGDTTSMLNQIEGEANTMGIDSTPTLFLNGKLISAGSVVAEVQAAVGQ